jgi:hypothetical protein
MARIFWQDDLDATVRYGDLEKSADGWSMTTQSVEGFPAMDTNEQSLVQMQNDAGIILVGIHDRVDGTFGSGWVAIDSGVAEEFHGDHSHRRLECAARVCASLIDVDQGNPAHVYKYGKSFVIANDKKNGFTITSAPKIRSAQEPALAASFHDGGNGHITLAVIDDRVAYATWIARDGDHCGRVDVIGLGVNQGKRYSIYCPSGSLHGATANSDKIFLAPSDGVCWVAADLEFETDPATVQVHHLALGTDVDGVPLRTGAFANLGSKVLFTTGNEDHSKLCWIDAASDLPNVQSLAVGLSSGETLSTPVVVQNCNGKPMAMLFCENKDKPETDRLLIVDLDPDGDGKSDDAVLEKVISIGRNQIEGHTGHHAAVVLPGGRELVVSNPGDGTLSILSLIELTVLETIHVGGVPTRLTVVGN